MTVIMSYAVGAGDMYAIRHNSDNFTIIDCHLKGENQEAIIGHIKGLAASKNMSRFICTHPDEDHFGGIEVLNQHLPISNFYVVRNQAKKLIQTPSFKKYCELRDSDKAFHLHKDLRRNWLNMAGDGRDSAGISVLWPDTTNAHFIAALKACDAGESFNNTSAVLRYALQDGASVLWLGDLETQFMENIRDSIDLPKTTIVFASHHGRDSGRIPHSWLYELDPQIIVIGEAPSRHLNYYTGYQTITQNQAGHIKMDCVGNRVDFYVDKPLCGNLPTILWNAGINDPFYVGSITVETQYTR